MHLQVLLFICFVVSNAEGKAVLGNKIVGGRPVNISEVPYQLSLHFNSIFLCGASLIKYDYALTAGHCVSQGGSVLTTEGFFVNAGSKYVTSDTRSQLKSLNLHPEYNSNTLSNDIAVLKLKNPFRKTANIQTITLPPSNYAVTVGAKVLVTGWGYTDEFGGGPAEELRAVEVQIVSRNNCKKTFESYNKVSDSMICAGTLDYSKDACYGDSGGPLKFGELLVGLVSWGYGCARMGYPGVYTEVAKYISFIQQCMR